MISKPTLFILGAGASTHLGYPDGIELIRKIVREMRPGGPDLRFLEECGFPQDDIKQFLKDLESSSLGSVDAFLEKRVEYIEIGKLAIARMLSKHENQKRLTAVEDRNSNWYAYLFSRMDAPTLDQFAENRLSVITFNYDRSFEQFLFTALRSTYGKPEGDVKNQLSKIPIVHVYGQLSSLPWQNGEGGREYTHNVSNQDLRRSAMEIKILSEGQDASPEFMKAKELIEKSERIYFLGFGYHETNMRRLGQGWTNKVEVCGSCFNLSDKEKERIVMRYQGPLRLSDPGHNSIRFLRFVVNFGP